MSNGIFANVLRYGRGVLCSFFSVFSEKGLLLKLNTNKCSFCAIFTIEKPLTEQLFLCYNTFTAEREPFAESFLHRKEHLFTCVSTLRKGEHFMTEEIRRDFLLRFARQYDLPGSAAAAGITRQQAYQLLRDPAARQMVFRFHPTDKWYHMVFVFLKMLFKI